ncbi:oxygen-independent coproporphyrinogen III oxidase [Novimethylophilus kurashikiensis]|uniref:Heme chaperone HemW n=1 Tax=Novimethylophilus kurashikiensis TaxID=1825523 RepID=A0A2R5FAM8_9PROT|nr:radical SAM family heme chaperone HemW [Novimethylophilus kurashikiensis]GBG13963.1 oxygen-independent coproporphyrinogen III oxidase [Novimethylophilus kurashikiensis]
MIQLTSLPPLSLYVHIPWCVRKCPYCDFNSHEARGEVPQQAYIDALIRDLEQALPLIWGRKIHTVFFGGGTPSLLSAEALDDFMSRMRALLPLVYDLEITLEANPGTFEIEKFKAFRDAGITRLSVGIQSFNADYLKSLGRIHDGNEARRAVDIALHTFDNVNLDLMYALPRQSLDDALSDIRTAIAFGPQHISAYHLTLEPNTAFHHQPPPLPDDDTSANMQEAIEAELASAGYGHYETSAFSRHNKQCRHNLNYWQFGDYLGIGAGAHSKISFADRILRQARVKHPNAYLKGVDTGTHLDEERQLTRQDLGFEFMMNALRLTNGFPVALFQERTGQPISLVNPALEEAQQKGLVTRDHLHIAPTKRGQRYLNELLQLFLTD